MFHYVEPTEEIQQKKRVVKQLIKVNKVDRGLGLTKPESVKVDDLLRACEDIETQGAIVLKSLSQSLLRSSPITQEGINRFYVVIKKCIFSLARSTFVQTPRSDIDNLVDYRDNIYDIMVALNKSFQELNEEAFGNKPLEDRTPEEYQAQTGQPYRLPVSAKGLFNLTNKQIAKEQERVRLTSGLQRIYDFLSAREQDLASIEARIEQAQELKKAFESNRDTYIRNAEFAIVNYDSATPEEQSTLRERHEKARNNASKEQRKIDDIDASLDELEQSRRTLPSIINNIRADIEEQEGIIRNLPETNTIPLSPDQFNEQFTFEKRAELVNADFNLVMNDLNKFINVLTNNLIRYTSSISSQLSRSQITNYRTPTQQAEAKYGAGIPKRFL